MRTLRIFAPGVCANCVLLLREAYAQTAYYSCARRMRTLRTILARGVCTHCVRRLGSYIAGHTLIVVDGHGAVSEIVGGSGCEWTVDWNLVIVGSQSVAMGVNVGEQTTLGEGNRGKDEVKNVARGYQNVFKTGWIPLCQGTCKKIFKLCSTENVLPSCKYILFSCI